MHDQKFIISAAFAVVNTHQPDGAWVMGYGLFSLCVIYKEGLCPVNRQMMIYVGEYKYNLIVQVIYTACIVSTRSLCRDSNYVGRNN
jgi:hypothetical protein